MTPASLRLTIAALLLAPAAAASAQQFFHFESPHVHPLELTPGRTRLLAVNTVDARLEVFDVLGSPQHLLHARSVPTGLEPVTVRARGESEAWVVNHVSDSITVVDLDSGRVKATIRCGDEPCDVVFAGTPPRAFVTLSQRNEVAVLDPADLAAAPVRIAIAGEDPRALVTDGSTVYAAIFECGNDTTIIDASVVGTGVSPYPGAPNPVPNAPGLPGGFSPPIDPSLPQPPETGQIVRKASDGRWRDENGADWSAAVGWDLHGHDLAAIDADTLAVSYLGGLMTTPMALAPRGDGTLVAVGTDAHNLVRFEPNLNGVFLRVEAAVIDPAAGSAGRFDLNPHLDYATRTVAPDQRALGLGDPRGVVVSGDGTRVFVTGMGSSNVAAVSIPDGARLALGQTGEGPTGIALDEVDGGRIFTLNRFDGSISVLDAGSLATLATAKYFDPTPQALRDGRPFLYDTHLSSGLGIASCASCHIDARMDQLAWDLGDPAGAMKPFDQQCDFGGGGCEDWHPMKGPLVTQTLLGLAGDAPFHWRGDRGSLAEFGHAANTLLSNPEDFTPREMARLEAYLSSISRMPNPNRNLDGSLSTNVDGGNAVIGAGLFATGVLAGGADCILCHSNPKGGSAFVLSPALSQQQQNVKVPHLTNLLEKTGFDKTSSANNRGFGYEHDGAVASVIEFLENPGFDGFAVADGAAMRRDVRAFLFSFDEATHASVGAQVTLGGLTPGTVAQRDELVALVGAGAGDLVVRVTSDAGGRSYALIPSKGGGATRFQSDVLGESVDLSALDGLLGPSTTATYTMLPSGFGLVALDRDRDGFLDGDERAGCSDPADPSSTPVGTCRLDIAGDDGRIDGQDLAVVLNAWGTADPVANIDCAELVNGADLALILNAWGPCQ
jgi:YVTN family beta-propeller protein